MKMDPWKTTPTNNDNSNDNNHHDDNNDHHHHKSSVVADTSFGSTTSSSTGKGGVNIGVDSVKTENYGPDYIIDFIRRVQTVPYLYNPDDENFRNVTAKQAAWKQIAEEFGQQHNWCMKKWVSLRDYFVKRKKLIRMGKPARPWVYYNELKFLDIIYGPDEPDLADKSGQSQGDSSHQGGGGDVSSYLESYYDSASNSFLYVDDGEDDNDYEDGTYISAEAEEPEVKIYVPSYPPSLKAAPNVTISSRSNNESSKRDANISSSSSSGTTGTDVNGGVVAKRRRVDNNSRQQQSSSSGSGAGGSSSSNSRAAGVISAAAHVIVEQQDISGLSGGSGSGGGSRINFREQQQQASSSSSSSNVKRRGSKNVQVEEIVETNEIMDDEDDSEDVNQEYLMSPSHHGAGGMTMVETHQDAYDLFCLSIAAHMRNMPKARAMQLQVKIMELMYNTEFPQYE